MFLTLIAIRVTVESNDSFTRFWDRALAGRTEVTIAVDADGPSAISPAMADAALPLQSLASAFQLPVHIVAADGRNPRPYVVRMSMRQKPADRALLYLNGAVVYRGGQGAALWLWADSPDKLRAAAQTLASRSGFPEIQ